MCVCILIKSVFVCAQVLKFLRATVPQIPLVRSLMPAFAKLPERPAPTSSFPPMTDAVSVTRTFCGALVFPSVAAFLGNALFDGVDSQLRRTALGGATFLAIKGVLKIYHKQHTYLRQCQRVILDHVEAPFR
jgi:E3 ubiquitin-protein ligase MARCH5